MDKPSKNISRMRINQSEDKDYSEFIEMLEAGMADNEIAAELGVSEGYVSRLKREVYKDYL